MSAAQTVSISFDVQNQNVPTSLTVAAGDVLDISAAVDPAHPVKIQHDATSTSGPEGSVGDEKSGFHPMPNETPHTLIGNTGSGWFVIGAAVTYTVPKDGVLKLALNDYWSRDNRGQLALTVRINGGAPPKRIDEPLYFDGASRHIEVLGLASPTNGGGDITVEFWSFVREADVKNSTAFAWRTLTITDRTAAHAPWSTRELIWDCGAFNAGGRVRTKYDAHFDKWTHVTLVSRDATGPSPYQAIYLDGVLAKEAKVPHPHGADLVDLFIGGAHEHETMNDFHKGWIGRFRVWNRALDADEVAATKTRRLAGSESGLVLAFDFDPSSTTVTNLVAGGPSGTTHGFTTNPAPPEPLPPTT